MKLKIIVLPDSHSKPYWRKVQNADGEWDRILLEKHIANRRYTWLSQFVIDQIKLLAPGEELVIIDMGDFADLKSLSSYDKGKAEAELERLELDIAYSRDARVRLMQPVLDYLAKQKKNKERVPKVRWVCLLGNHENRWARFRADNPAWVDYEAIPDDITLASALGAEVIPFLTHYRIADINFCHYFYKKDPRYAIAGEMPARTLFNFLKRSAVAAHNHEWDVYGKRTIVGETRCMYVGAFYEHDEKYPGPQGHANIWRGITVMSDCHDGSYNEVKHPMADIKKKYWKKEEGPFEWADVIASQPYTEAA